MLIFSHSTDATVVDATDRNNPSFRIFLKTPWGTKKEDVIVPRPHTAVTFCSSSCVCVCEERNIEGGYSGQHHRLSFIWKPNVSSVRSGFEKFDGCAVFRGAPSTSRSIYLVAFEHEHIDGLLQYPAGIVGLYFPLSFSAFVGSILSRGLTLYIRRLRLRLLLLLL